MNGLDQPDLFTAKPMPAHVAYHDSTGLDRAEHVQAERSAQHQDAQVLAIFLEFGRPMTPSQVWRIGCDRGQRWLLTSVRRAITNLTNARALVKLNEKRPGCYGRPELCWRLIA